MRPVLPDKTEPGANRSAPVPSAPAPEPETAPPLSPFRLGEASRGPGSTVSVTPAAGPWDGPARMDRKTLGRMAKGKLVPDARIDLHGKTVEEAHGALIGFILSRQSRGDRLVLVITGKGRGEGPAAVERGVLRRQVPHWLSLPPLAGTVLDVAPAHRRHGGEGALYVYLRRLR